MVTEKVQRYYVIVNGQVVYIGVTSDLDLESRKSYHRVRWPDARIQPVGDPTTREKAFRWEKQQIKLHSSTV